VLVLARRGELIDQLDRASMSVLFNTAEGNGKRQGRQRAKFFDDARGWLSVLIRMNFESARRRTVYEAKPDNRACEQDNTGRPF
jgi:four helix bundle protein